MYYVVIRRCFSVHDAKILACDSGHILDEHFLWSKSENGSCKLKFREILRDEIVIFWDISEEIKVERNLREQKILGNINQEVLGAARTSIG